MQAAANDADYDVLATVGAGDIDTLVPQLRELLTARWQQRITSSDEQNQLAGQHESAEPNQTAEHNQRNHGKSV